jgi:hypothetical protein
MSFKDDIFISYRHLDNESEWVDNFHERLRVRLGEFSVNKPRIWRDIKNLTGGEYFADVILERLANTKVFIAILSPGYIERDWCKREVKEFCRLAELNRGVRIGNKSRVIKAVKFPVPREKYPQELQGSLDYMFFDSDPDNDRPLLYSQESGGDGYQKYLGRVDDLALYIKGLLEDIDKPCEVNPPEKEKTVYVAQTSSDLLDERDKIVRELQDRGYFVLPDKELPHQTPDYQNAVQENLKRACLSIHLIGEKYGLIPEDETKSIVVLQNEIAAEFSHNTGLPRLIWIPDDIQPIDERQLKFISSLQTNSTFQEGAELLCRPFEALKTRIIDKLTTKPKLPISFEADLTRIYLMCDKQDFDTATTVGQYLFEKGYEVIPTAKSGEDVEITKYHKENLEECDATLIYYGNTNELWLRSKLWELKKAVGWRQQRPMLCKAIFITDPETEQKQQFKTWEAILLPPSYKAFSTSPLDKFIKEIENAKKKLGKPEAEV